MYRGVSSSTDKMNNMNASEIFLMTFIKQWNEMVAREIQLGSAITFENLYGNDKARTFMKFTPYLWILPFVVTVVILVVFKRAQLFGHTQIYLIIIMVLDLVYTLLTAIRDGYISFSKKDYGYIEYDVCRPLLVSVIVQTVLHGSSMWVKCLMSITHTIFIAFPLKCRSWNLKRVLVLVLIIHIVMVILCIAFPIIMPLKEMKTIQIPEKLQKPKTIQACVLDIHGGFYDSPFFAFLSKFLSFTTYISYMILPTAVCLIFLLILLVLLRKQIKMVSIIAPHTAKKNKIKYLTLMKVNIILGISFLVQESPLLGYYGVLLASADVSENLKARCYINMIMTTTFAFGKPLDLLIYASLSTKFRQELMKLFRIREKKTVK
jgi:hypothetical protein